MSSLDKRNHRDVWWRSLDDPADASRLRAFLDAEFPASADPSGINRRRWLQLMGASLALAAAGGCRSEKLEMLSFAERPEDRTPGKTERFATAMPLGDTVAGLEVTCVDGRPIKIEGNPRHPQSLGATDVFAQAALLALYDPDRSRSVTLHNGKDKQEKTWKQFEEACKVLFQRLQEASGAGFRVLAEANGAPTLAALRERLLKAFPRAKWFEYEPLGDDNARAGAMLAYGRPLRTHLRLDRARCIVCLDADPLGNHPAAVRYARDFTAGRQPESGRMSRLYVVESGVSLTGAAADHRFPLRASRIPDFVAQLENALLLQKTQALESMPPLLRAIVDDLLAADNRGRSIVCAGPSQPPEVHAAVHRINARLKNIGENGTVAYTRTFDPERSSHVEAIQTLVEEMNHGKVDTLLILGGNPVYNAPADLAFGESLQRVKTSIHLSEYRDETSRRCTWHLPRAHFLETWGDGRSYDGTYSVVQPMIAPLRNGRSPLEVLATILATAEKAAMRQPEELVRRTFREQIAGSSKKSWRQVVRDGLLAESRWPFEKVSEPVGQTVSPLPKGDGTDDRRLEVIFRSDRSVYDGRFANNSWLQELPDPVTRLTWGGAALVGPATAEQLGIKNEELAVLKLGNRHVRLPIYVLPGQALGTVELPLGYGRSAAGNIGGDMPEVEPVGVDVYPLRTTSAMHVAGGATLEPTGETYRLAGTQNHQTIDAVGREVTRRRAAILIRQATLEHYRKHPDFAQNVTEHPPLKSLWQDLDYEGHRWGMAIDLSKCIGCGACVVACQAENNIPVVGRQQVLKGREMHWLRVDRYFRGEPDAPELAYQPLPCQQCELAPCEQVCPVAATSHSHEGLNDMVYNRCVGVRYCANNCPYKVRHFNFFNYHKEFENPENEIAKMKYNPQVTVRSRGVMEKCTYCVQRIQAAKITAKNTGEAIHDGQIQTACQQVCPTGAIVFGDLADRAGEALRLRRLPRAYAILAELNVRPRTIYLARIRNPNPALESIDVEHDHPTA
jgi:molybdopterin-containing oxidoreductase family iron-sulfur binding subunit